MILHDHDRCPWLIGIIRCMIGSGFCYMLHLCYSTFEPSTVHLLVILRQIKNNPFGQIITATDKQFCVLGVNHAS